MHDLPPGRPAGRLQAIEARARRALQAFAGAFFAAALAFAAFAHFSGDTFFLRLATEGLILGGLALAVDVLLGLTGLLSLGQALFFGLGAYVSALVLKHWAPSFWLALAVTLACATLFGAVAGLIANRAKGVYFALITFGLAQVVAKVVYNTRELGASDGLIGIPVLQVSFGFARLDAGNPLAFFLLTLGVVGALLALVVYLRATPFGRMLAAIRANESRVPFLGADPWRYKLAAFVLAANIAAISGALYPMLRGFVSPELMFFQVSGNAVVMVILGGVGTLIGPLYGAMLLTALKSAVGTVTEHHHIVIGVVFIVAVISFPRGLAGYLMPKLEAWLARRPPETAAERTAQEARDGSA
jgi:branched-chain amino acid transport system permease protein